MLYFRKKDETIEKYQVTFDKEELIKIKNEIINNCSLIKHREYESDYPPSFSKKIIRNYKSTPTGNKMEYFEEARDIYRYSYDEYNPPYLVELINQLLNDNSDAIDKILNYDISKESTIDDRIELANQDFDKIAPQNITMRKEKLNEIAELFNEKELNKNQQSIEPYYNQLIEQISFNLIDSLSISELDKIELFFEIELYNKVVGSDSKGKDVKSLIKIN